MIRLARVFALVLSLSLVLLASCSDDDPTAPVVTTGSVEVHLKHMVDLEDLVLDSIQFSNAFGNNYSVEKLQYFISKVELRGPDGEHLTDIVHFADAEDPTTLSFTLDGIEAMHYHMLTFTFGLDDTQNITGALPNPPESNMFWPEPWGGGYHYMKLEGRFRRPDTSIGSFTTHTGRGLVDGVEYPHYVRVGLIPHLDVVAGETRHVEIIMDINQWYAAPNVIDLESQAMIMNDQTKQHHLEENCNSVFRIGEVGEHHDM